MKRTKAMMRRAGLVITLLAVICVALAPAADQPNGSTNDIPGAISGFHLVSPVAAGEWTMPAGDYGNLRFSPLDRSRTSNVTNLHVITTHVDRHSPRPRGPAAGGEQHACTWSRRFRTT